MAIEKHWNIQQADATKVKSLAQQLNVNERLTKLLILRGIDTYEAAEAFFKININQLHDPFLMKDMDRAIKRIGAAIANDEQVMIYGDYDVDGTTSVAIVYQYLTKQFPDKKQLFSYYIPHRYREGYGISIQGIDHAIAHNINLIIALDCGIKAVDKVHYAKENGIDFIVCDHHTPGQTLPEAVAILNPKQTDCNYPYKDLSACGIGYKLITAISMHYGWDATINDDLLDLVATSIAADIVPVTGENRILAFLGLEKANTNPCLAIKILKELAHVERNMSISDLVFMIGPRINAAGRMDDAKKAVALFIAPEEEQARALAALLQSDNQERKELDRDTTKEAIEQLYEIHQPKEQNASVLFQPHWHKGIVGIVASRVIDYYYKPTIVLTESEGKVTGSARSVKGFNIHDAILQCEHLLDTFGGHFFAAGLTMPKENLQLFIAQFEQVVTDTITESSKIPEIDIDCEINLSDINERLFRTLNRFAPFGPDNMKPVFLTRNVQHIRSTTIKDEHLRMTIAQNGSKLNAIGFNLGKEKIDSLFGTLHYDIVYTIEENEWKGSKTLQLRIIDIRSA